MWRTDCSGKKDILTDRRHYHAPNPHTSCFEGSLVIHATLGLYQTREVAFTGTGSVGHARQHCLIIRE